MNHISIILFVILIVLIFEVCEGSKIGMAGLASRFASQFKHVNTITKDVEQIKVTGIEDKNDHDLLVFGSNKFRIYADGTFSDRKGYIELFKNDIGTRIPFIDVDGGSQFTVLLTESGKVFTSGKYAHGDGTTQTYVNYQFTEIKMMYPEEESEHFKIVKISAGMLHAGALSNTGLLFTWGLNTR